MPRRSQPVKYCRYCGRMITLDATECPYCSRNVIKEPDQKECPFCGERIRARATKCKHCGEFVSGPARRAPGDRNVVYIDKAVITGGELTDRQPRRISPAEAEPVAPPERQLPAGGERALVRTDAQPPAAPPKGVPPARRKAEPPPAAPEGAPAVEQEVELQCPSCRRPVFEHDRFCENCGRDLSIPPERKEFPGPAREYVPSDYALMLGTAAPLGLLFGSPVSLAIALAAAVLGAWCVWRVGGSHGELLGLGRAVGGLAAALFWLTAILLWGAG